MEGAVGPGLFETLDRGIHGLSGGSEGTGGQHLDLLCVSNFGTCLNDFLMCFLELLGEVSELQYLSFDEGVSQPLYCLVDNSLIRLSGLKDLLSKGIERRLRSVAWSCAQLNCEDGVSFPHGEVCTRTGVVEYEAYVLGFAFVVVGVVNRCGDAKPSVGPIFDERRSWMCVSRGIIDDFLVRSHYHHWGCRRSDALL